MGGNDSKKEKIVVEDKSPRTLHPYRWLNLPFPSPFISYLILFFFQGFINPSFPFLLLSLPFHSFGEMIKKKDNEEVNHYKKEKIVMRLKVCDEVPTWRCQQNPFIGALGIQEPVILGEPQI